MRHHRCTPIRHISPVAPDSIDAACGRLGVPNDVLDVPVPHVGLDARPDRGVPSPPFVRRSSTRQTGLVGFPLRDEDGLPLRVFLTQSSKDSNLHPGERMRARSASLTLMTCRMEASEVHLGLLAVHQLADAETVAVAHEDHGPVAVSVAPDLQGGLADFSTSSSVRCSRGRRFAFRGLRGGDISQLSRKRWMDGLLSHAPSPRNRINVPEGHSRK